MSHIETLRVALDGVMRYLDGYPKSCGHKLDCNCALQAARAALAATAAPAQPVSQPPAVQGVPAGWISVTKKKPALHERVLIIAPDADDDPITAIATFNAKDVFVADGGRSLKRIKYWQPLPLPAAPQLGEQND